jgi:hypothetical protein
MKLPTIFLPSFEGDICTWLHYRHVWSTDSEQHDAF